MFFTEKFFQNNEPSHEITIETKKKIILDSIDLIENSEIFDRSYGKAYNKIEVHGRSFFIEYDKTRHEALLKEIFKDLKLKHNFSKDYVDEFIIDLTIKIFKNGITKVEKNPLVVDIFEDSFYESIVYIPLDGIRMEKQPLIIGKIKLREFTQIDADFHLKNISNLLKINPHYTDKKRKEIINQVKKEISDLIGVCAEFKVYADPKTAIDIAKKECDKVLDLLNWITSYVYSRSYRAFIGFKGEIPRSSRNTLVAKIDFSSYHQRWESTGALYKLEISNKTVPIMHKIGLFKVSEFLKKPKLKPFEKSLLTAIHWFADCQMQDDPENEILSLMIAMETLLSTDKNEPKSSFISEATAILLGDEEHKKELKNKIKSLYDKRSRITHEGQAQFKTEDVDYLRHVVKDLIYRMVKNKDYINSQKALIDYISDKKDEQKLKVKINLDELKKIGN